MAVRLTCPNPTCSETLSVPESMARRSVSCPACQHPVQIGRFQVRARLGAGSFGAVYRAFDPQLERDVALKVPKSETLQDAQSAARFQREAKAAAKLLHLNIVPVHEVGEDGGRFFTVTAFIPGHTLAERIPDGGLEAREAVRLAIQLAQALAYAHEEGVIHRDVKPGNLLIDGKGTLYVIDFGLAGWLQQQGPRLTQSQAVIGTPAYMSPEQASGDIPHVGPAADQYSAGATLYHMLTGDPPFLGPTDVVLFNVRQQPPLPPSRLRADLDPRLEEICLKAMAKNPADRYADCQAFADALQEWLVGAPSASGSAATPTVATQTASWLGAPHSIPVAVSESGVQPVASQPDMPSAPLASLEPKAAIELQPQPIAAASRETVSPAPTASTLAPKAQPPVSPPGVGSRRVLLMSLGLILIGTLAALTALFFRSLVSLFPNSAQELGPRSSESRPQDQLRDVRDDTFPNRSLGTRNEGSTLNNRNSGASAATRWAEATLPQPRPTPPATKPEPSKPLIASKPDLPIPPTVPERSNMKPPKSAAPTIAIETPVEEKVPTTWIDSGTARTAKPEPCRAYLTSVLHWTSWVAGRHTVSGNAFLVLAMEQAQATVVPLPPVPQPFTSSLGMKFVWIAPGQFDMGSPDSDTDASADEKPCHRVTLTKGFFIAAHPVTQKQYKDLIGTNPSGFGGIGEDRPVEFVSWEEAQEFCRKLTAKEGRKYRLPTEAEWEYACRAGTTSKYHFGDKVSDLDGYAWFDKNAGGETHSVGQKKPNPWGLYDMHGNVWQWCQDGYDPGYYQRSPAADPLNAAAKALRVIRGGSWINAAGFCRSSSRYRSKPGDRDFSVGFRVVADPQ